MRAVVAAFVLPIVLAAAPASAEPQTQPQFPPHSQPQSPGEMAREGLDKLLQSLDLMVRQIPQFEAPTFNEDGDIIIRRKDRDANPGTGAGADRQRSI